MSTIFFKTKNLSTISSKLVIFCKTELIFSLRYKTWCNVITFVFIFGYFPLWPLRIPGMMSFLRLPTLDLSQNNITTSPLLSQKYPNWLQNFANRTQENTLAVRLRIFTMQTNPKTPVLASLSSDRSDHSSFPGRLISGSTGYLRGHRSAGNCAGSSCPKKWQTGRVLAYQLSVSLSSVSMLSVRYRSATTFHSRSIEHVYTQYDTTTHACSASIHIFVESNAHDRRMIRH